mgnify:CR=1 FL=1
MSLTITELLVEYMEKPIGLDEKSPRFSWKLESDLRETLQTSCRIFVFKEKEKELYWDSGEMYVRESRGILRRKRTKPCTDTRCEWKCAMIMGERQRQRHGLRRDF